MSNWLVVHTKPGREKLAKSHLEFMGAAVVQPLCSKGRALFPRYLFAKDNGWAAQIRHAWGVSDLLRAAGSGGKQFVRLTDEAVAALVQRDGEDISAPEPPPRFKRGDAVVVHGLIRAKFEAMRGPERVQVLIRILGGQRRSVVDIRDLELADG